VHGALARRPELVGQRPALRVWQQLPVVVLFQTGRAPTTVLTVVHGRSAFSRWRSHRACFMVTRRCQRSSGGASTITMRGEHATKAGRQISSSKWLEA